MTICTPSTGMCGCVCVWYLGLFDRGVVFVAHGADLHASLPLPVPLAEELVHDAVGPLPVQLQGLGRVAEVRTVHHVLENLEPEPVQTVHESQTHTHPHRLTHTHTHRHTHTDTHTALTCILSE